MAEALDRKRSEGAALLDLTQSNPTAAGIEYPIDGIAAALADHGMNTYEPSAFGLISAREAVSKYYSGAVPPEHILLTASTSEAYTYLFKALCNPDDEVLSPRPSYPLFELLAQLESIRIVQYPLRYHEGWYLDIEALRQSVTDRTRAIVFVSPNNPTGQYLKPVEREAIAEICREHGLALIVDEVFADYGFSEPADRTPTAARVTDVLTFTLSGLSKAAGLPQMKLGWMAAGGPQSLVSEALHRLELIADTYLSVGAPVQYAAPALLASGASVQHQIRRRTRDNLGFLREKLADSSMGALDVEAGWYAIVRVPSIRTEEEWVLDLIDRFDTVVQPGYFFDFESETFLVLSLLTEPETFRRGVEQLLRASP